MDTGPNYNGRSSIHANGEHREATLSPRGRAIPGVREQLFQAADRLLASAGPAALTTRAITSEAGVANGVLHRHFHDLDTFLAEFTASRLAALADTAAALPSPCSLIRRTAGRPAGDWA